MNMRTSRFCWRVGLSLALLLAAWPINDLLSDCCNDRIAVSECFPEELAGGCAAVPIEDCPPMGQGSCESVTRPYRSGGTDAPKDVCKAGLTTNTLCEVWEDRKLCYRNFSCERFWGVAQWHCVAGDFVVCHEEMVFVAVDEVCDPCES